MSKRFFFLIPAILLAGFSYSQTDSVEKEIDAIMKQQAVVGLTVGVVKKNKIIYSKAFGYKELSTRTPLQTNDLFRIASISKSFSATAVMKLVDAGQLSLDDDFGRLVGFPVRNPKYPDRVITLRMILSHTSSVNDSEGYFNLDVINPAKNPNWRKCYNDYAPGEGYQYCNLNFNMVGAVLEKISGVRFDNYIRSEILKPLQLQAGYCVDSLDNSRFVTLYDYDSTGTLQPSPEAYAPRREQIMNYVMGYTTPIFSPTGGMKISSADLTRYMMMHMNFGKIPGKGRRLIKRKSSRTMQTAIDTREGYGLALWNTSKLVHGEVLVGHTGSAYGLYSAMFFHPGKKFGFVVITNGCKPEETNGTIRVLHETINCLYKHFIR